MGTGLSLSNSSSGDKKGQSNDSTGSSSSSRKRSNDKENDPDNAKVRKTDDGVGDETEPPAANNEDPAPDGANGNEQQPRARVRHRSPDPPAPRESHSTRRLIVDQQNQAYQASLQADREKELKKEKERKEKLELEETAKALEMLRLSMKEEARQNLPSEPVRTPGGGDEGIFTLQFRYPSAGISFRRNFRNTDTLQVLIQFVMSHASTPVPFHLVRRPNQVIPMEHPDHPNLTLHEMGFGVSEVLLVHDGEVAKTKEA